MKAHGRLVTQEVKLKNKGQKKMKMAVSKWQILEKQRSAYWERFSRCGSKYFQ